MSKKMVAIVGRPNVGKSTLFNTLAGERLAIVKDTPGVTRDRIYADAEWLNWKFTLVDTGGIDTEAEDVIMRSMREQAEIAIETADVIIFVTDVRSGVTASDIQVADMLRKSHKNIVLCVNKVDNYEKFEPYVYEFYNLGIGDPYPVSALGKQGLGDLLEKVVEGFGQDAEDDEDEDIPRVAVIGKPNTGKSSIINKLIGSDRLIVSDIAGTTRDAIDTRIKHNGSEYVFIDTAGLRRKSKIKDEIERFSIIRTVAAVERCDIAILVIDASEGVTDQDAKIAGIAHERGKGMIIVVNKWDLIEKDTNTMNRMTKDIKTKLSYMPYAEMLFVSALTGQRLNKLYDMIDMVYGYCSHRIQTGVINEILMDAVAENEPPQDKGRRLKLFYMTQVSVKPPTFVLFVNDKELSHFSYIRYLENKLREAFLFRGTPIRILLRERNENK
ncbi:MAG: ribosome biogenesis GTPase Der [Eubacterium sp.]|nr:ribosome biogenesis GTPase Der [Eubacterium sp.]